MIVLKNLSLELFPKFFTCCLQEKCFLGLWKVSILCPSFKNLGEYSSKQYYCLIRLLSFISKYLESFINQKVVYHLKRNNHLNDKQYEFCSFKSTTDVLVKQPIIKSLEEQYPQISQKPLTMYDIGSCYTCSPLMTLQRVSTSISSLASQVA